MDTIEISKFESEIVLFFRTQQVRINAYTLASTLVAVADAAREANSIINPGYDIEVVVTAFSDGSFKAVLRAIYKTAENLFSKENIKTIILAIISTYIYEHTLAPNRDVKVIVNQHTVIIEQGETKIVVPKDVYEAKALVEKSERFKESVSRTFRALERDEQIEAFAVIRNIHDEPTLAITHEYFHSFDTLTHDDRPEREVIQHVELQIVRAILEKSTRKWQFVWAGIRLSAPVLDDSFYKDFSDHKITIAPGDSLEVDLKMYQRKEGIAGIYTNYRYEVVRVVRHIPKVESKKLM